MNSLFVFIVNLVLDYDAKIQKKLVYASRVGDFLLIGRCELLYGIFIVYLSYIYLIFMVYLSYVVVMEKYGFGKGVENG